MEFQKPDRDEWGSGLEAMEAALHLEKTVNQSLLDLHKVADTHGDAQVCFFERFEFLYHQSVSVAIRSLFMTTSFIKLALNKFKRTKKLFTIK